MNILGIKRRKQEMTFKELLEELFNDLDTDDWRNFTILFLSIFKKAQDDKREMNKEAGDD